MKPQYKNLKELGRAIDSFVNTDHPIRCKIEPEFGEATYYDIIPEGFDEEEVYGILVHDAPNGMKAGERFGICVDNLFQVMTWETIASDETEQNELSKRKTA